MKKGLLVCILIALMALSSCSMNQSLDSDLPENTPISESTETSLLTFDSPAVSFEAFEIDYAPDVWREIAMPEQYPYLESLEFPGCIFHTLYGSGNGPYGEEYYFSIDGQEFAYYLNAPQESSQEQTQESSQEILIYLRDPEQSGDIRWGFQVYSNFEDFEQCFDLVKGLLSTLRYD
ncbi:MAG: hypothetical protein GX603_08180 [Chloroflexi bacterium]|nr:hypothetical protein [Chloroflexota bacterium]